MEKTTYFVTQQLWTQGPHTVYHLKDIICGMSHILFIAIEEASVRIEMHSKDPENEKKR